MSYVEDTQIKDAHYQPGTILDGGKWRVEFDSMGQVTVPADRLWGAQTQRSLIHFSIGNDHMPIEVYHAYGYVKKAAAIVNESLGKLAKDKADLIVKSADEVIAGKLDENFPLYVWQTGSGTQSNMNVNEVISNRAIQLAGGELGSKTPVHPNDDVNMGQSSNDTFPTAMHIAALTEVHEHLLPSVREFQQAVKAKALQWQDVVKIGRTHLEDAVPLTVGQEWSGYAHQLTQAIDQVTACAEGMQELAAGGTAVGTGLNAPPGFGEQVAAEIAAMTGAPFQTAGNKFTAQGTLDRMVRAHAGLKAAAVSLFKFANDLRWLGSGPRTGIHELIFPSNEPGSSIMPGKVNPTQAEAMLMVAIQVIASDVAVTMGGNEGNFELNAFRPILIDNYLHSALIMADMCDHLREFMIEGTKLNEAKLKENIERSVMMVTALSPVIGYDKAAAISYYAIDHDQTLKQAALANGVSEDLFDKVVIPIALTRPGTADVPSTPQHSCHAVHEGRAGERPRDAGRPGGADRVGGRPARLGRLGQSRPPAAAPAGRVHRHGRADLRAVGGRGHPGPVRRSQPATLGGRAGALPGVGVVAGGGRLLPRRHLRPLQPGHHPGVRVAAGHGLGDGRRLLGRPVRGRGVRVAAGPRVLRPGREPGRHHAPARPVLAARGVRGHHHLRPGAHDPQHGQRAQAQRAVRAARRWRLHPGLGDHGRTVRGSVDDPGPQLRARRGHREPVHLVGLPGRADGRRHHRGRRRARAARPGQGAGGLRVRE